MIVAHYSIRVVDSCNYLLLVIESSRIPIYFLALFPIRETSGRGRRGYSKVFDAFGVQRGLKGRRLRTPSNGEEGIRDRPGAAHALRIRSVGFSVAGNA